MTPAEVLALLGRLTPGARRLVLTLRRGVWDQVSALSGSRVRSWLGVLDVEGLVEISVGGGSVQLSARGADLVAAISHPTNRPARL